MPSCVWWSQKAKLVLRRTRDWSHALGHLIDIDLSMRLMTSRAVGLRSGSWCMQSSTSTAMASGHCPGLQVHRFCKFQQKFWGWKVRIGAHQCGVKPPLPCSYRLFTGPLQSRPLQTGASAALETGYTMICKTNQHPCSASAMPAWTLSIQDGTLDYAVQHQGANGPQMRTWIFRLRFQRYNVPEWASKA